MTRILILCAAVAALGALATAPAGAASTSSVQVSITSPVDGAHSLSGIVPVLVSASADMGIYSVQLLVDGLPLGAPVTTAVGPYEYEIAWDTSGINVGTHVLTVVATDWSQPGGGVQKASAPVTVDVGPPYPAVTLTAPQANTFARGTVALAASVSGGQAPTTVSYAVDGKPLASNSWNTTSVPDGSHTVSATVTDGRGKTASDSATVAVDNTPPTTSIAAPAAGSYAQGSLATQASASDAYGIASVQFEIDGAPVGNLLTSPDSSGGYLYSSTLSLVGMTSGTHSLTDVATDNAGNVSTSASVTFTIGYGPPAVTVTSPADWTFAHGTTTVTANVTGGTPPDLAQLYVDGTPSGKAVTAAPYSFSWDTTKLADGSHTVTVKVTDAVGRTASSGVIHQTVDNTPPTVYVISPVANGVFTGSLPAQVHASDAHGIANVQLRVDGAPIGSLLTAPDSAGGYTYSTRLDLSALANGKHTLTAVASDAAGNVATSAAVAFYVGGGQPTVAISSPAAWSFARQTIPVTATVTAGTPPFTAVLAVDGVATTATPTISGSTLAFAFDTTKIADGTHTLQVNVTDAAATGASSSPISITVDNTAPTVIMTQPVPLAGYSYARTGGPTTLQVHASDAFGIASVQFTVDGNPVGALLRSPDTVGGYLYSMTLDASTLAPGMHSLSAIVTDNAGNTVAAAPVSLKSGPVVYVPVINYHGIEGPLDTSPDEYDQTATEADQQLAYLKANGYRSITMAQYETWLTTGALPPGITKPVLLTIDDGLADEIAWDQLLQKYGFSAVLYVVTGFADNTTPGEDPADHMTWAQIQSLAANGRWTIAFHAGEWGHGEYSQTGTAIRLNATQTESYATSCWTYYTCLGQIKTTATTGAGRTWKTTTTTTSETPAQLEAQVTSEIDAGMAELKQKVPSADLSSWPCPWNACGQWTNQYNDSSGTIQGWLPGFAASQFKVVFMQTDPIAYGLASGTVGSLNGDNRRYRFEVLTSTTIPQFAAALTDSAFANN